MPRTSATLATRWTVLLAASVLAIVTTGCGGASTAADEAPSSVTPTMASASASASSAIGATDTSTDHGTGSSATDRRATDPSTTTTTTTTTTISSTRSTSTTTGPGSGGTQATTSSSAPTTEAVTAPEPPPRLTKTNDAFDTLSRRNPAVSMTVMRDGEVALAVASGSTIDGSPATDHSPMVVASVSKLITSTSIARLAERGRVTVDGPVPWTAMGIPTDPAWADVTVRELLDHTSGMPVVRTSWFDGSGDCRTFLPTLVDRPPQRYRGRWTYSNGNYCALGLLVESVTGLPLGRAAQQLVFDPIGVPGVHLTTGGQLPGDIAYAPGVDRLARLGGAGTFIVSTADLAAALAATTSADRVTMRWPSVITDQYGWGHTGTVGGAMSCAWVLEFGRTVVVTTVAGASPGTGGAICDLVVPAVAQDLGIAAGRPDRSPP